MSHEVYLRAPLHWAVATQWNLLYISEEGIFQCIHFVIFITDFKICVPQEEVPLLQVFLELHIIAIFLQLSIYNYRLLFPLSTLFSNELDIFTFYTSPSEKHGFPLALFDNKYRKLCLQPFPPPSSWTREGYSLGVRDYDLKEWYEEERVEEPRPSKEKPCWGHWEYPQLVTLWHSLCPVLLIISLAITSDVENLSSSTAPRWCWADQERDRGRGEDVRDGTE